MSVYLGFLDKPKHATQMISTAGFMSKNRITINNPVQTHYTVEGVQSYAIQQIKALKERQQRLMQGKEGTYAPLKVVLLSDQLIEFDQDPKTKINNEKAKLVKQKVRPATAKKQKVKTNARNATSANNQAIVKLQKQVSKKNALQQKLQKMSKKYKQYFKQVDLKEGLKSNKNIKQQEQQQQQQGNNSINNQKQLNQQQKQQNQTDKQMEQISQRQSVQENPIQSPEKIDKTTYHRSGKGKNKKQSKKCVEQSLNQSQIDEDLDKSAKLSVRTQKDPVKDCTSYSQKLGTAIHQLFR